MADGSFAELARARADKLVAKPARLTFEQAAAAPVSRAHRAPGPARVAEAPAQSTGARDRCRRRGGHLRRPDRQGLRRGGHRRVQHQQARPRSVHRCRRRRRLHEGRLHRRGLDAGMSSSTPPAAARCPRSGTLSRRLGTLVIVGGDGGGRWTGCFLPRVCSEPPLLSPFVGQKLRGPISKPGAGGPPRTGRPHRDRQGHTGRGPDLPIGGRARRHPLPGARTPARQDRDQRLIVPDRADDGLEYTGDVTSVGWWSPERKENCDAECRGGCQSRC